jgi:hypothetical protein
MKTAWSLLGTLLVVSLSGTSALASGTVAVTKAVAQARAVKPAPQKAESLTEIFNTFSKDGEALYDCCSGWVLEGKTAGLQYVGVVFTPAADTNIRKIVVGLGFLGYVGVDNSVSISLRADSSGLPGEVLGHFKVADVAEFGTCCETETAHVKGIPVTAGTPYWVVAKPADAFSGVWNLNVVGVEGPFAGRHEKKGWYADFGNLPAIRILGD